MRQSKRAAEVDKARTFVMEDVPGKSRDRALAEMLTHGVATNAATAVRFAGAGIPGLSLNDMVASLREQGEAVNRGDLSEAERMLNAQAVALDTIFA